MMVKGLAAMSGDWRFLLAISAGSRAAVPYSLHPPCSTACWVLGRAPPFGALLCRYRKLLVVWDAGGRRAACTPGRCTAWLAPARWFALRGRLACTSLCGM